MDTATAALYFRFCPANSLPADVSEFLAANGREVADALPHSYGLRLFEHLGLDEPNDYVGRPEPVGSEAWKDRGAYVKLRTARGEIQAPDDQPAE